MPDQLNWRSLEQRQSDARLYLHYKMVHRLVTLPLPDYVQLTCSVPLLPLNDFSPEPNELSQTVIRHILLWIIGALYTLGEYTGNSPLSLRILVNL